MKAPTWERSTGALLDHIVANRQTTLEHLFTTRLHAAACRQFGLPEGTVIRWTDGPVDAIVNGLTFRAACAVQGRYVPPIPPPVIVSQWYTSAAGSYWRDGVTGGPTEESVTATTNGSVITHQHDTAPGYCLGNFLVGAASKFSGVQVSVGNPTLGSDLTPLPVGARTYDVWKWCDRGSKNCPQGATAGAMLAASPNLIAGGGGLGAWGNKVKLTTSARAETYSNVHLARDDVSNSGGWVTYSAGQTTYYQGPGMPIGSPGWQLVPMSGSGQILFDASAPWVKGWPLLTAPPQASYADLYWALVILERPTGLQSWLQGGASLYRTTTAYGLTTVNVTGVVQ